MGTHLNSLGEFPFASARRKQPSHSPVDGVERTGQAAPAGVSDESSRIVEHAARESLNIQGEYEPEMVQSFIETEDDSEDPHRLATLKMDSATFTMHGTEGGEIEIKILEEIGQGASGVVKKGAGPEGHEFAIKEMHKPKDPDKLALMMTEITAQKALSGLDHVLPILGLAETEISFLLLLPLGKSVNLQDTTLSVDQKKKMLLQALKGLTNIHTQGYIHGDFKGANLIEVEGSVLVADFGLTKPMAYYEEPHTNTFGTPTHMSKSAFSGEQLDGEAAKIIDLVAFATELYLQSPDHQVTPLVDDRIYDVPFKGDFWGR